MLLMARTLTLAPPPSSSDLLGSRWALNSHRVMSELTTLCQMSWSHAKSPMVNGRRLLLLLLGQAEVEPDVT